MPKFLSLLFFLILLGGCAKVSGPLKFLKKEITSQEKERPLPELLSRAERNFQKGSYDLAEQAYQEIKSRYPGAPEAVLAELRLADIKYWSGEYLEAIALYEEFEKFYPTNEAIPYVIFQIGTCYYKIKSTLDRDPTFAKKAIFAYERLLENYPDSPYTLEAKRRIQELRELLAHHELYVARFYYRIQYYRGAYNRLLYLLENYPETQAGLIAKSLADLYYRMALQETEQLNKGTKRDFFGSPIP